MSLELYYQITEDVIKLPPLRDRGEDLELIADDQFEKLKLSLTGEPGNIEKKKLSVGAKKALKAHDFPGNLRELSNVLTRALIHSAKDTITQEEIEEATGVARLQHANGDILDRAINKDFRLEDVLNEVKVHYIQRAERIGGGVVKASALLGIKNYQTLTKWKKDLGLNRE